MAAFHRKNKNVYSISSYKLAFFCGSVIKISIYLRADVSPSRPKLYISSYKLTFFLDLESKLLFIYVVAFHQKGHKCTLQVTR